MMIDLNRNVTAEPTTNIAEDREEVPQAADLIKRARETMLERTCPSDQAYVAD